MLQLIGTCGVWFIYDFVVYKSSPLCFFARRAQDLTFLVSRYLLPNGVFSGAVIANIVKETGKEKIRKTAEWQLLLSTIALPGCIVGALLVNKLGRRNLSELPDPSIPRRLLVVLITPSLPTVILGFTGYLIIGLIVGIAYPQRECPLYSLGSESVDLRRLDPSSSLETRERRHLHLPLRHARLLR